MTNGNGGSVKLLYWIMGALLAALLGLVQWNAASAQRDVDSTQRAVDALREQLYSHELQALGGYQRISRLEGDVSSLLRSCACSALPVRGEWPAGGGQ